MKAGIYTIRWQYRHVPIVTYCDIIVDEKVISTGRVSCYHKDQFCKETGRKLSLSRALFNAGLSKQSRREVWEAYRNMTPKKRW